MIRQFRPKAFTQMLVAGRRLCRLLDDREQSIRTATPISAGHVVTSQKHLSNLDEDDMAEFNIALRDFDLALQEVENGTTE